MNSELLRRQTIQERQDVWWDLSRELFGDVGCDINDFELHNYRYFVDNVGSLEDLKRGLCELSPLADDALDVAEAMNNLDFAVFKLSLAQERRLSRFQPQQGHFELLVPAPTLKSTMPKRFLTIVAPSRFIRAAMVAPVFETALGAMLIRIMEIESGQE